MPSNPIGQFYGLTEPPQQNPENDFDFSLPTKSGVESLDLMEIAPLKGGSYETAPFSYNHGELADAICEGIAKKSARYGGAAHPGVHLMLHATDLRFVPTDNVLWLVAKWCALNPHAFKSVVYLLVEAENGTGKVLHPQPKERYEGFDEEAIRNRRSLIGNLAAVEGTPDGGAEFPLGR